jgi:hypothetical protein
MKDVFENSKDDFDGWVEKWEKALEDGIFKPAPQLPSTAPHTSHDSFFGLQQSNQTDYINPSDSEYWNAINGVADGVDMRLDEAYAVVSPRAKDGPNPVRRETEGKDQDLSPHSLGLTFDEGDVEKLSELKTKLHGLQSDVAKMEDNKGYDSKIKAMIAKIDELSNKMGRTKD